MSNRISQREARRMRKELREIKERERERLSAYSETYPGGVRLFMLSTLSANALGRAEAARMLGCAFVGKLIGATLHIYAVPTK